MKLSMFTILSWLEKKGYKTDFSIKDGSPLLKGLRINQEDLAKSNNEFVNVYSFELSSREIFKTIVTNSIDSIFLEEEDITLIYDEVLEAFSFYNDWERELFNSLITGEGLNKLLDIAHDVFKRPMFIKGDSSWAFAITSGYDNTVHPDWGNIEKSIQERTADFESVKTVSLDPRFQFVFSQKYPIIIKSPFYGGDVLRTNIWIDGQRLCEIIVIENGKPFNQGEAHLLYVFSQIVEKYILKDRTDFLTLSDISIFFIEMIESNSIVKSKIPLIRKALNWDNEETLAILCVKSHTKCETPILGVLRDKLSKHFKFSCFFSYQNNIVGVISVKKNGGYAQLNRELKEVVLPEAFTWGVSYDFDIIEESSLYYKQALAVIGACEEMKRRGANMYEMACTCMRTETRKISELDSLIHPALKKLKMNDMKKCTDYFETLYYFLLFGCNYTNTANYLNLHRNSLIYRISRIQEIIEMNLDDLSNIEVLLMSFFIMRQL